MLSATGMRIGLDSFLVVTPTADSGVASSSSSIELALSLPFPSGTTEVTACELISGQEFSFEVTTAQQRQPQQQPTSSGAARNYTDSSSRSSSSTQLVATIKMRVAGTVVLHLPAATAALTAACEATPLWLPFGQRGAVVAG